MSDTLISIIVPIYNVEKYLDECVRSLINQTYRNIEIILVDDGSPDNCPQMCDKYALTDSRIRVVHKKNGGLSDARNAGIEVANGKYYAFIDSDDYISVLFIEMLYNAAVSENAQIVQTNLVRFRDGEMPVEPDTASPSVKTYTGRQMNYNLYGEIYVPTVVVWSKLYRAELFDNIRFPVGKINEDEFTTYKLFYKSEKVCFIDLPLYFYRFNSESIMNSSFSLKRMHKAQALEERMKFYRDRNENELYLLTVKEFCRYIRMNYYKIEYYINPHDEILSEIRMKLKSLKKDFAQVKDADKQTKKFVRSPQLYGIVYMKVLPKLRRYIGKLFKTSNQ
ncbi:MAG: glycosyltransferase family 2 protein [Oscillospiraceae bacterium]|nr:glycosyltransferase family 2 protein [Oscillospiraceae bacterium]